MSRILTLILIIVVFAVGTAFSARNMVPVEIDYYYSTLSLPLSVLIIVSIVIGIIIGSTIAFISTLSIKIENSRLKKSLSNKEQELNSLRILPIKDEH